MGTGPHHRDTVLLSEIDQTPNHIQRHRVVLADDERKHRVILSIDMHLKTFVGISIPYWHRHTNICIVH